ncbi:MAG: hypothetical protein ACJASM_000901 [Salibacteraceae bacterium]|jgi:hypothetical protein
MKKKCFEILMKWSLVIAVFAFSNASYSQSRGLLKGDKSFGFRAGSSFGSIPNYYQLEFGVVFKEKMQFRTSVFFDHGMYETTNYTVGGINMDFMYSLFAIKERVYFNVGIGAMLGNEGISSNIEPRTLNKFVLGARGVAELNIGLSEKIAMSLEFSQWYVAFSNLGDFHYTGTVGIHYNIK